VQGTLAALLIAGSIGSSLDLFRKVGLVLFAEQLAAAAFGIGLALTFLRFHSRNRGIDWLLFAASLVVCGYLTLHFPRLTAIASIINAETLSVSIVVTALTLEAVRRTIGWSLVIILLALAAYALLGHLVPGQLQGRSVETGELLPSCRDTYIAECRTAFAPFGQRA